MEIWLVLFQNSSNLCNKSLRGKYKQPAECGAHVLADLISFTVQSVLASLSKMFFRDFIFLINCFAKLNKKKKKRNACSIYSRWVFSSVQVSGTQVPDNVKYLDIFWEIPLFVPKRKSCPFFQCYLHQQDVDLRVLMAPLNCRPFDQSGAQTRAAFFLFAFSQDTKLTL